MQSIAAAIVVVVAGAYILWRVGGLLLARRRGGCGSCGACPAEQSDDKSFVPLDSLR